MGKKSNNAEYEKRVNIVFSLLLNGLSRYEIIQYASRVVREGGKKDKEDWNVSTRQIDTYMADANELIYAKSEMDVDKFRERCKRRFDDLYKRAIARNDVGKCVRIMEMENKILGFERLNVAVNSSNLIIERIAIDKKAIESSDVVEVNKPDGKENQITQEPRTINQSN